MNVFWKQVAKLLIDKGITKTKFAEETGLPIRSVQNWFYRNILPDAEQSCIIAKYLGVSVEYLVTGTEPSLPAEEAELIQGYSKLPPQFQEAVKDLVIKLSTSS